MEMQQVRYFVALAGTLNFTRAAEQCNVSQPALTRAIQQLEHELGGPLFHRERNRLRLTEFGRQMEPLLAGVLERAAAARSAAESLRLLNQPPVRVRVMPTLGPVRLSAFLAAFERAHPGVEVAIHEGRPAELAAWLEADALDAAILNPIDAPAEGWRLAPLYTERYVVLLPPDHPLEARDALALGDLAG